ncbi:ScbR family autoregulator-binding transcription factor [Arthrobacter sp. YA7-1]|jgi:AcrR family transcriptional regulator|uniref:ScbR family autoregulator-binding transcription factor n=1 Tax=Arthrobacter TaxID=1663 RepID=UPI001F507AAF|nr:MULTISPECIES: ScbR family autoregulator-binding transcription factor [Arthrobacter]UYY80059.1 ScbR family autoregulator-binding transcription factor [Arthrobacter sp. YA7-1]
MLTSHPQVPRSASFMYSSIPDAETGEVSTRIMQQRAKATRTAVIEGAASIFEEVGYGNASLSDVTERASVTKGALYFHFKSKEDLALAVIAEQHNIVRVAGEKIASAGLPALETMIAMCRTFGQQLLDEPVVRAGIRLTFEASAFNGDVKGPYQDWVTTMEMLTRQAQLEGDVRPEVDAGDFARYLVASFTGVQMVSNVLTERRDVLKRIEDMWRFMMPAIAPIHGQGSETP